MTGDRASRTLTTDVRQTARNGSARADSEWDTLYCVAKVARHVHRVLAQPRRVEAAVTLEGWEGDGEPAQAPRLSQQPPQRRAPPRQSISSLRRDARRPASQSAASAETRAAPPVKPQAKPGRSVLHEPVTPCVHSL
eukprot:gene4727-biopygen12568